MYYSSQDSIYVKGIQTLERLVLWIRRHLAVIILILIVVLGVLGQDEAMWGVVYATPALLGGGGGPTPRGH